MYTAWDHRGLVLLETRVIRRLGSFQQQLHDLCLQRQVSDTLVFRRERASNEQYFVLEDKTPIFDQSTVQTWPKSFTGTSCLNVCQKFTVQI